MNFEDIIQKVQIYNPKADVTQIHEAYVLANDAHKEQKRASGEPYITHPLAVTHILGDLECDDETLICGLLHDVVEDTEITLAHIQKKFGKNVSNIIERRNKILDCYRYTQS